MKKYSFRIFHSFDNIYTLRVYDDYEQNFNTIVMSTLDTMENIVKEIEHWNNRTSRFINSNKNI